MLPSIVHASPLNPSTTGLSRYYVTVHVASYGGGTVNVTSKMCDGLFDEGDIMVHLPGLAFVADHKDMKVIH